ncbi:hypothetical protein BXZ70DRAFT_467043 [Cristinia sonorae]|uniref:Uncharacterized protein n=1 Tax=Cristinia sonorae TaxID=1940300 RepID=A0A8K0UJM0_9AGAR|nr:hypothetical protein BXZ70DRAFT_467043 [Cristinia sonorae]
MDGQYQSTALPQAPGRKTLFVASLLQQDPSLMNDQLPGRALFASVKALNSKYRVKVCPRKQNAYQPATDEFPSRIPFARTMHRGIKYLCSMKPSYHFVALHAWIYNYPIPSTDTYSTTTNAKDADEWKEIGLWINSFLNEVFIFSRTLSDLHPLAHLSGLVGTVVPLCDQHGQVFFAYRYPALTDIETGQLAIGFHSSIRLAIARKAATSQALRDSARLTVPKSRGKTKSSATKAATTSGIRRTATAKSAGKSARASAARTLPSNNVQNYGSTVPQSMGYHDNQQGMPVQYSTVAAPSTYPYSVPAAGPPAIVPNYPNYQQGYFDPSSYMTVGQPSQVYRHTTLSPIPVMSQQSSYPEYHPVAEPQQYQHQNPSQPYGPPAPQSFIEMLFSDDLVVDMQAPTTQAAQYYPGNYGSSFFM